MFTPRWSLPDSIMIAKIFSLYLILTTTYMPIWEPVVQNILVRRFMVCGLDRFCSRNSTRCRLSQIGIMSFYWQDHNFRFLKGRGEYNTATEVLSSLRLLPTNPWTPSHAVLTLWDLLRSVISEGDYRQVHLQSRTLNWYSISKPWVYCPFRASKISCSLQTKSFRYLI